MKLSMKRRRHLKILAQSKKSKKIFQKSHKFKALSVCSESKLIKDIKAFVLRKSPSFMCTHYLVGSASINRLLSNVYTLKRAHGTMRRIFTSRIGSIGEQTFAKSTNNYINHCFSISRRIPFLCSTPDFFIFDRAPILVEVKAFENIQDCDKNFRNIPKDFIVQIWSACEIFGIRKARLLIYHSEHNSGKRNHYGQDKWVSLYGTANINIRADFFSPRSYEIIRNNYLSFFTDFLDQQNVIYQKHEIDFLIKELDNNYYSHKRLLTSNKNLRNLVLPRTNLPISEFCQKQANFDEENENFGSKDSREKEK